LRLSTQGRAGHAKKWRCEEKGKKTCVIKFRGKESASLARSRKRKGVRKTVKKGAPRRGKKATLVSPCIPKEVVPIIKKEAEHLCKTPGRGGT